MRPTAASAPTAKPVNADDAILFLTLLFGSSVRDSFAADELLLVHDESAVDSPLQQRESHHGLGSVGSLQQVLMDSITNGIGCSRLLTLLHSCAREAKLFRSDGIKGACTRAAVFDTAFEKRSRSSVTMTNGGASTTNESSSSSVQEHRQRLMLTKRESETAIRLRAKAYVVLLASWGQWSPLLTSGDLRAVTEAAWLRHGSAFGRLWASLFQARLAGVSAKVRRNPRVVAALCVAVLFGCPAAPYLSGLDGERTTGLDDVTTVESAPPSLIGLPVSLVFRLFDSVFPSSASLLVASYEEDRSTALLSGQSLATASSATAAADLRTTLLPRREWQRMIETSISDTSSTVIQNSFNDDELVAKPPVPLFSNVFHPLSPTIAASNFVLAPPGVSVEPYSRSFARGDPSGRHVLSNHHRAMVGQSQALLGVEYTNDDTERVLFTFADDQNLTTDAADDAAVSWEILQRSSTHSILLALVRHVSGSCQESVDAAWETDDSVLRSLVLRFVHQECQQDVFRLLSEITTGGGRGGAASSSMFVDGLSAVTCQHLQTFLSVGCVASLCVPFDSTTDENDRGIPKVSGCLKDGVPLRRFLHEPFLALLWDDGVASRLPRDPTGESCFRELLSKRLGERRISFHKFSELMDNRSVVSSLCHFLTWARNGTCDSVTNVNSTVSPPLMCSTDVCTRDLRSASLSRAFEMKLGLSILDMSILLGAWNLLFHQSTGVSGDGYAVPWSCVQRVMTSLRSDVIALHVSSSSKLSDHQSTAALLLRDAAEHHLAFASIRSSAQRVLLLRLINSPEKDSVSVENRSCDVSQMVDVPEEKRGLLRPLEGPHWLDRNATSALQGLYGLVPDAATLFCSDTQQLERVEGPGGTQVDLQPLESVRGLDIQVPDGVMRRLPTTTAVTDGTLRLMDASRRALESFHMTHSAVDYVSSRDVFEGVNASAEMKFSRVSQRLRKGRRFLQTVGRPTPPSPAPSGATVVEGIEHRIRRGIHVGRMVPIQDAAWTTAVHFSGKYAARYAQLHIDDKAKLASTGDVQLAAMLPLVGPSSSLVDDQVQHDMLQSTLRGGHVPATSFVTTDLALQMVEPLRDAVSRLESCLMVVPRETQISRLKELIARISQTLLSAAEQKVSFADAVHADATRVRHALLSDIAKVRREVLENTLANVIGRSAVDIVDVHRDVLQIELSDSTQRSRRMSNIDAHATTLVRTSETHRALMDMHKKSLDMGEKLTRLQVLREEVLRLRAELLQRVESEKATSSDRVAKKRGHYQAMLDDEAMTLRRRFALQQDRIQEECHSLAEQIVIANDDSLEMSRLHRNQEQRIATLRSELNTLRDLAKRVDADRELMKKSLIGRWHESTSAHGGLSTATANTTGKDAAATTCRRYLPVCILRYAKDEGEDSGEENVSVVGLEQYAEMEEATHNSRSRNKNITESSSSSTSSPIVAMNSVVDVPVWCDARSEYSSRVLTYKIEVAPML